MSRPATRIVGEPRKRSRSAVAGSSTSTDALARGGELCVCDLAWIVGRAQNLVSHHLRTLRAEGLAESRRAGKFVFSRLRRWGRACTPTPRGTSCRLGLWPRERAGTDPADTDAPGAAGA